METAEKKITFSEMINSDKPVLVDFYADWCGPCKVMAPKLVELSSKVKGKATVIKIDVDKNQSVANHYQIRSIPTLVLFKNGSELWRQSGVVPVEYLEQLINKFGNQ